MVGEGLRVKVGEGFRVEVGEGPMSGDGRKEWDFDQIQGG